MGAELRVPALRLDLGCFCFGLANSKSAMDAGRLAEAGAAGSDAAAAVAITADAEATGVRNRVDRASTEPDGLLLVPASAAAALGVAPFTWEVPTAVTLLRRLRVPPDRAGEL